MPCGIGDLNSPTSDRTRVLHVGGWILNPWTTREVPALISVNVITHLDFPVPMGMNS